MWFPRPYLPKSQFGWKLRNRQRFARWYWNPMWKTRWFCAKWLTRKGIKTAYLIVALHLWIRRMDINDYFRRRFNKERS